MIANVIIGIIILSVPSATQEAQQQNYQPPQIPLLNLQYYSKTFGGDSRGIPSLCSAKHLIGDILVDDNSGGFAHPSGFTRGVLRNVRENGGEIDDAVWSWFFGDTDDSATHVSKIQSSPLSSMQCLLTTCTSSLSSLSYCSFSALDVHDHLVLLSIFASNEFGHEIGGFEYAESIGISAIAVWNYNSMQEAREKASSSSNGTEAGWWEVDLDSLSFVWKGGRSGPTTRMSPEMESRITTNLRHLSLLPLHHSNFSGSLKYLRLLLDFFPPDELPLDTIIRAATINLVIGDVEEFGRWGKIAEDVFERNVLRFSGTVGVEVAGDFYSDHDDHDDYTSKIDSEDSTSSDDGEDEDDEVDEDGNEREENAIMNYCNAMFASLLPYLNIPNQVQPPLFQLFDSLHNCFLKTFRPSSSNIHFSTTTLDPQIHYSLGLILHKRGFSKEAHRHLSLAASPYEHNSRVNSVGLSLSLPLVFGSLQKYALERSAFEHEVAKLLNDLEEGGGRDDLCGAVAGGGLMNVPLVTFIDDEPFGGTSGDGGGGGGGGGNFFALVSRVIYGLCPQLRDVPSSLSPIPVSRESELRVGIVSSKLYSHNVLKLHGGLIDHLSRSGNGIKIFAACFPIPVDPATRRVQRSVLGNGGGVINLVGDPGDELSATRMRDADLDVILYLDPAVDPRTLLLAHRRLARVQIALWGHSTYRTGIENAVDYIIVPSSVANIAVQDEASEGGSEQLVFIEGISVGEQMYGGGKGGVFPPSQKARFGNRMNFLTAYNIPETANVITVPASVPLFHPEFDVLLKKILKSDERIYVMIGTGEQTIAQQEGSEHHLFRKDILQYDSGGSVWFQKLRTRMKRKIGGGKGGASIWRRIRFMKSLTAGDYSAVLSQSTIVLDTYPRGNLVPSMEALSLGIPVITIPGKQRAGGGRRVVGVLNEMQNGGGGGKNGNYTDCCIANNEEEAISKISKISNESKAESEARKYRIKSDFQSRIKEDDTYFREVEQFILKVAEK